MTEGFEVVLHGGDNAAWLARRALEVHVPALPRSVKDDVSLLVTELISNAVRHGGASEDRPIRVGLRRDNGLVRVEVVDHGTDFEPPPEPSNGDSSGGWGLFLVDRIAERWGVRAATTGTCVWFELAAGVPP